MSDGAAWSPRPDPALQIPVPPGVRPHRHPPDQLHGWVFLQHQIWVDYWGNEHEIESMPLSYVANVIRFCVKRAERIHQTVALDALCDGLADPVVGEQECEGPATQLSPAEEEARDWLLRTPLLQSLARRSEPGRGGMEEHRSGAREERQYRHPNFRHEGQLYLVRCFACSERGTENLMRLAPDGVCATCGWRDGDAVPESGGGQERSRD